MSTLTDAATTYFASINPIAAKIMKDQQTLKDLYKEQWNDLEFDTQEELVDSYIVDSTVKERYQDLPKPDPVTQWYPKMVVESGEKIIIDFENDGWTWQDEHSAPFSWETKSQMNLSFNETDDDSILAKPNKKWKRPKSPKFVEKRLSGIIGSPEIKATNSAIWNSPFMAAERGDDADFSGKKEHEHVLSEQSYIVNNDRDNNEEKPPRVSTGEAEDLFKTYGISFAARNSGHFDSPSRVSPARSIDRSSLSPSRSTGDHASPSRSGSFGSWFSRLSPSRSINKKHETEPMLKSGADIAGVENLGMIQSDSDSDKQSVHTEQEDFGVLNYGLDQKDAELTAMLENAENYSEKFTALQLDEAPETDLLDDTSPCGSTYDNMEDPSGNRVLQDFHSEENTTQVDPSVSKTGFDFLDDW